MFTGDASGNFLFQVLHETGFASQPKSTDIDDGMKLKDAYITAAGRYATVDRWESAGAMEVFKKQFAREYEELDRICGELTVEEEQVGVFETG